MDLQTQLNRLEQQLAAFEKLHREELEAFGRKLEAFRSLQADEIKMLRAEIDRLRRSIQQPDPSDLPGPTGAQANRESGQRSASGSPLKTPDE